jgi:UDP-N-acetylglucosamine transferase subunit ALG13
LIFVTLGTDGHPFERALDMIEPLVGTDRIIVQHGATRRRDEWSNARWFEFVDYGRQRELVRAAAGVVAHAGVGSIMTALALGVRPVVIARRTELGEHVDDHQVQILTELAARGLVIPALDTEAVRTALGRAALTAHWTPQGRLRKAAAEAVGEIA